jgi:hypothetical protein
MSDSLNDVVKSSLLGAAGLMWVVGGIAAVWTLFGIHWLLGWVALFIWVWGCWAGVLYFDLARYFKINT